MKQQLQKHIESNEEISKEDVEIRRVIEERRTTPKEEKQRLNEVSKHIKNVSGTRKERKDGKNSANIWRLLRD